MEAFPGVAFFKTANPDEVVANGAAILAGFHNVIKTIYKRRRAGVDVEETVKQAKTQLLETFRKGNYVQFQEGKLRSRKQRPGESAIDYFYDIISL